MKKCPRLLRNVIACCALAAAMAVNSIWAATAADFEHYLKATESVRGFTGAAMIAQDGAIIYSGGFGKAEYATGRANTSQTAFLIGSITKSFTAAAIMKLQEAGKLLVSDKISKYLPDFPEEAAEKITIHHLLTHTAGLANYTSLPAVEVLMQEDASLEKQINVFASLPLEFEPGSQHAYSNSGYKLLEAIINNVSGRPWHEYVRENILLPAKMEHTGYGFASLPPETRAVGYAHDDKGARVLARTTPSGIPGAAGALYSTVTDFAHWDRALREGKILSEELLRAMFTPFLGNYAYGWVIDQQAGHARQWHDGAIFGFSTMFIRFPDEKLAIAVFSNDQDAPARQIAAALGSIALGEPYDLPVRKSPSVPDLSKYDDYVGAYAIGDGQFRIISREGNRLFSQRTGGARIELLPEAVDQFFFEQNHATTIKFDRDSAGVVMAHMIHQEGIDARCDKLPAEQAAAVMPKYETVEVDSTSLARYPGVYELNPLFAITITQEGTRLFGQATGQSRFELFPKSATRFFLKVVEAEVEFKVGDSGLAESLTLFQGGIEQVGRRKP